MTAKEALEKADFFSAASAGRRDEIAGFAYIRRYGKGAHVFYDREESTCLYFLVEGVASLYKINSLVMVLPADRFIQVMDKDGRLAREVMGPWLLKSAGCTASLRIPPMPSAVRSAWRQSFLNWAKITGYVQGTEL